MRSFIFVCALFIFCSHYCQAQQNKWALVIAIGDYPDPESNGWIKISSGNDAPMVSAALESQGFPKEHIRLLQDAAATKPGIVKALDDFISKVKTGDVAVIHISSHGEQLEDDNDDEIDGLDECIVPFGAAYSANKEKFASYAACYLRDDEFGDRIIQLRNKLGTSGDLLVVIDACHSGSATRGPAIKARVRGSHEAMVSANYHSGGNRPADNGVFMESTKARLSNAASSFAVISGAQATERNYECEDDNGTPVGSLSYSFSKALSTLPAADKTSYRGLFSMIEDIMRNKAPFQKPALEGDGIDRELFGGQYIKQKPYFTVTKWNNNRQCIINAGSLSGLTPGSIISFYAPNTFDPGGKLPMYKGSAQSVNNYNTIVTLDTAVAESQQETKAWAFITELGYGGKTLRLNVRDINGSLKKVKDGLKEFASVSFDSDCQLYLDTLGSLKNWALKDPNTGVPFASRLDINTPTGLGELKNALRRYERYSYLQGLSFKEDGLAARVELVFLNDKKEVDTARLRSRMHFGRLELKEDDVVYLKIVNTGQKKFYVNIIDMQPDGVLNAVLPNRSVKDASNNPSPINAEDCVVNKYDSLFRRNYSIRIGPPYGDENFKIFLSADPLDLESILIDNDETKSRGPGGVLSNMAKVFQTAEPKENGTRGVETKVNTNQNGTIFNFPFRIVPQ